MSASHLIARFFGAVAAKSLSPDEQGWVDANLLEGEQKLWRRMSKSDQRHAHGVASKTVALLGEKATRPVIAAALLHDIGKVQTPIGTFNRVLATLAGKTASVEQRESWSKESGWLGRAGQYLMHHEIGAEMLTEAGSDPLTVAWAREHELPSSTWTLPEEISDALYKADN